MLCVDEKSHFQALDRTALTLPMQIGITEKQTHDYVRNGTTTLLAALEIETGEVTGICRTRHRHQKVMVFLEHVARAYPNQKLHPVIDNLYPFHADVGVVDEPRRGVVRDQRTSSDPPWTLPQCPRTHEQYSGRHQRMEPAGAAVRLDENRRAETSES